MPIRRLFCFLLVAVITDLVLSMVVEKPVEQEPTKCGNKPLPIVAHGYTAKSCLDHMKNGATHCGYYVINDGEEQYTVFCDINSEIGAAYTLIESFALKYNKKGFQTMGLTQDFPVNHNSPQFDYYRLTNARMLRLSGHSTHWRATCNFPQVGIDYHDYIRGKLTDLNPVTYKYIGSNLCKRVEVFALRGRLEFSRTVGFRQGNTYHFYHDSTASACDVKATPKAVSSEDNWGYYANVNPAFRCTSSPKSTTQYWLGGYL